ncbi:MAG TPA: hypothetical protein VKN76_10875 [Kiloniellaceae bacterium]|nr:hypothetical protein [Kiloniellaceae bacterium]
MSDARLPIKIKRIPGGYENINLLARLRSQQLPFLQMRYPVPAPIAPPATAPPTLPVATAPAVAPTPAPTNKPFSVEVHPAAPAANMPTVTRAAICLPMDFTSKIFNMPLNEPVGKSFSAGVPGFGRAFHNESRPTRVSRRR